MSEEISKAKRKRLAMQRTRKEQKQRQFMARFWAVMIPLLIIAAIAGIVLFVQSQKINYSKYLTADGTIADINIDEYCTTTYENMSFSKEDIVPDDYQIENDIQSTIEEYAELKTDADLVSKYDDKVNISYTATVSGNIVEQYDATSGGRDYTIGSSVIDYSFDEELIGRKVGDTWNTTIAFDSEYYNSDLAGQTVLYAVTLDGIYVNPEFTDQFVAQNLGNSAQTVEEYRQNLYDEYYDGNLRSQISSTISENCILLQYPEKYLNNEIKVLKNSDIKNMDNYNNQYAAYGIHFDNPWEIYGLETKDEYNAYIEEAAKEQTAELLYYQAVFTKAGLTLTEQEVQDYYINEYGLDLATYEEDKKLFGYNYMAKLAMMDKVTDYLVETVKITE